ncbi:MAG: glycosyltransferase family 2 protein [Myxococcaceae bacterium]|nr:glycosyltransferase family 2 protein [Myxococcaceae bacterium]
MKLSVTMIVRDEAAMLPGCLERLGECELVVVDTGSTDATRELAKAAGARVFDFTWRDDFAAARNFALEQCTGDVVLVLDADERVSKELWAQLMALPASVGAATVLMRNVQAGGSVRDARLLRVFRRHPSIRYRYAIHEDVSESVRAYVSEHRLEVAQLGGVIEHLGYTRDVMASKGKRERDQRLLEKHLEVEPTNLYSHFKLLELARFWADDVLSRRAAEAAHHVLEHSGPIRHAPWAGELVVLVGSALWPKHPREQLAWLEAFSTRITPSAAWQLRRAELYELLGHFEASRSAFAACAGLKDQLGDLQLSTVRPRMGLARLAWAEGKLHEAFGWTRAALALAPEDQEALFAFGVLREKLGAT